ncbi:AAA family ATPase [Nocardioides ganghwensis]|uniref:AAA family ATPase n=1 Tax=Nocardioides ganghwensis TaxID=252230 RepID=UPI0013EB1A30|nr:AAA family ATPase [Nocardioides ganghwensis]MBD3947556.1 AAA family ATPase [Nocardioides ganghwensis]
MDKTVINSVLYRRSDLFQNDGAIPPNWSLLDVSIAYQARKPYRVGALVLKNWKSFEDVTVAFGGVTLVYGENSSGKSALFQALRVLKDSWGAGDIQLERYGWLEHVIHRHDLGRQMVLSATWLDDETGDSWTVGLAAAAEDNALTTTEPIRVVLFFSPEGSVVLRRSTEDDGWVGKWLPQGTAPTDEGSYISIGSDSDGFPDPDEWLEGRDGLPPNPEAAELLAAMLEGGTELFDSVEFLPPARPVPPRDISLSWAEDHAAYLSDLFEDEGDLQLEVNEWLHRFEIPYTVTIDKYGDDDGDEQFELSLIRDGAAGEKVQLRDVGFGVSQLLPIIVELLTSREKTLLIEEPEAHVHPRLQSVLGDLFVTSNQDYGNVVIVETHSEPLLLRLQRRIAEGRIAADGVRVLHVLREGSASEIRPVGILQSGQLDYQWPGGFFDNRMDDLVAIFDPQQGG